MKLNPTYSPDDINFIHDEAQIFVESILNHLDDNITPTLGDDGKYHYVYLTINKINGFFYIGKASFFKNIHLNGHLNYYYGGGVLIQNAIKQYGKENFLRFILKFFKTSEEAFSFEEMLVDQNTLDKYSRDLKCMYNQISGGKNAFKLHTNEIIKRRNALNLENWKTNRENKKIEIFFENIFLNVPRNYLLEYLKIGYKPTLKSIVLFKDINGCYKRKLIAFYRNEKTKKNLCEKRYFEDKVNELIIFLEDGWSIGSIPQFSEKYKSIEIK